MKRIARVCLTVSAVLATIAALAPPALASADKTNNDIEIYISGTGLHVNEFYGATLYKVGRGWPAAEYNWPTWIGVRGPQGQYFCQGGVSYPDNPRLSSCRVDPNSNEPRGNYCTHMYSLVGNVNPTIVDDESICATVS